MTTCRLRALLERYLTEQGFQVRSVANAEQMDRLLTRESFHLYGTGFNVTW
ncbi:transcriptional regulatory protein OmpR [Escherichia coli]|uniref:Transcriptional regulatory protein OmpR n=1 Tax=Escherichia coli TaxID=562 RepID=A0A377D8Q3_ECOLX|nr:transcriptional regulatory protein OmpR [Escherichia coli]